MQFVIRYDKEDVFSFSSLQSEYSRKVLKHANGQDIKLNTVIFQFGERRYTKSDAALEILRHLGGGWRLLYIFKVIPKYLRDPIYDFIAARRYRWFGKKDQCMVPTPELQARFLD